MRETLQRWGGILIRPRATLEALRSAEPARGSRDSWWLGALFVLGSQVEELTATLARFELFGSYWLLLNGLLMALLPPLLVGMLAEGLVGAARARYRHLPLVPLVLAATVGNLLHQSGIELPGPRYAAEIAGTVWAAGLAIWIRKRIEPPDEPTESSQTQTTADATEEVTGA